MELTILGSESVTRLVRKATALICTFLVFPGDVSLLMGQSSAGTQNPGAQAPLPDAPSTQKQPALRAEQLDSLVAPIALYPDPMLAQTLAAATYPLEIIQLQQWLEKHKELKDKALADAVSKQPWDPSVQALAGLPEVVKRLANDIQWTTDLGNAFLAQQSDLMDAVQRMRQKAQSKGNLKSSEQQKVETKVVDSKSVIVVEQANPQVVYVPSYDPVVVYGAPAYPYPPIYYPPPGYYAAGMAISFGVGVAMGAFWSGGWGWGAGWGGNNNITVNRNNNFNRNTSVRGGNRVSTLPARGGSNWQHNPSHRGGAPYGNREVANKFGGTARGDSAATRRDNARANQGQSGNRQQAGGGDRTSRSNLERTGATDRTRSGDRASSGNRSQASTGDRSSARGGGDRVGNRSTSSGGGGSRSSSAFGGGSGGFSGSSARASSGRGSSSFSGSRGGGSRGGGRRR